MTVSKLSRAKGAMAGLAVGDALGRPVEGLSAEEIRKNYGSINDFLSQTPGGSDDTEYAILTGRALVKYGSEISAEDFAREWLENVCYQSEEFLGAGFSESSAIANLKAGLLPPQSGIHIHSWSDGLAMRVAPIGIVGNGDIEKTRRIAIADGQVSHAGEGIHSGVAIAVAISAAMSSKDYRESFDLAHQSIPVDSWTYRNIADVKNIVLENMDQEVHVIADKLLSKIATHDYSFADLAPEAAALALSALLYGKGDFVQTLLFAVNLGRDADTIAAMAGAMAGT
ncbi:MAG: crystallin J1, partial [Actinobacteria bacterium]|nr:crystallin J1 [Actinomycetota bacterium]